MRSISATQLLIALLVLLIAYIVIAAILGQGVALLCVLVFAILLLSGRVRL